MSGVLPQLELLTGRTLVAVMHNGCHRAIGIQFVAARGGNQWLGDAVMGLVINRSGERDWPNRQLPSVVSPKVATVVANNEKFGIDQPLTSQLSRVAVLIA